MTMSVSLTQWRLPPKDHATFRGTMQSETPEQNASSILLVISEVCAALAGMSTFSTKGGLYERAQRRYGVTDGKKLFTYSFFEKQRLQALVRHTSHVRIKILLL